LGSWILIFVWRGFGGRDIQVQRREIRDWWRGGGRGNFLVQWLRKTLGLRLSMYKEPGMACMFVAGAFIPGRQSIQPKKLAHKSELFRGEIVLHLKKA
jgi:hypothetical protein